MELYKWTKIWFIYECHTQSKWDQEREMENAIHQSSLEQDTPPTPPAPGSTRKPGGWKAIKYIIGNLQFTSMFWYFSWILCFLIMFSFLIKGMNRSRSWHQWAWYPIWQCTWIQTTTSVVYLLLMWSQYGMVPPTLHH